MLPQNVENSCDKPYRKLTDFKRRKLTMSYGKEVYSKQLNLNSNINCIGKNDCNSKKMNTTMYTERESYDEKIKGSMPPLN